MGRDIPLNTLEEHIVYAIFENEALESPWEGWNGEINRVWSSIKDHAIKFRKPKSEMIHAFFPMTGTKFRRYREVKTRRKSCRRGRTGVKKGGQLRCGRGKAAKEKALTPENELITGFK